MRRISVASVPSIHMFRTPARKQEEQLVLGQTAKLYERPGFFDDEKLVRDSFKCLTNFAST